MVFYLHCLRLRSDDNNRGDCGGGDDNDNSDMVC